MWPLSAMLHRMYEHHNKRMKTKSYGFIAINRHLKLDTMLFADCLVVLATSKHDLQRLRLKCKHNRN